MTPTMWRRVGIVSHLVLFAAIGWITVRLLDMVINRDATSDPHGYILFIAPVFISWFVALLGFGIATLVYWLRSGSIALLVIVDVVILAGSLFVFLGTGDGPAATLSVLFVGVVVIGLVALRRASKRPSIHDGETQRSP
jgi:hypothetical protein